VWAAVDSIDLSGFRNTVTRNTVTTQHFGNYSANSNESAETILKSGE